MMKISLIYFTIITCFIQNCQNKTEHKTTNMDHSHTNQLIDETSPYLLQHAHNPVNWYPWGDEAFEKAQAENKLVLVSIGYSACHWCHVMERESFEDTAVAKIMNEKYICIKVDREERPDVDQVYMTAVQLMTQRGGWPLNCFTLPDGRPVFGGTYYPKDQWMQVLKSLAEGYEEDPNKYEEYAASLTAGVQQSELIKMNTDDAPFVMNTLDEMVNNWSKSFDYSEGGPNRAPKFPVPNNYDFLMQYGYLTKDEKLLDYVKLTLNKIAYGGIYDHVGGGFARYSTDANWKVPHFEKMLYDNAQLVSLYADAYRLTKNEDYKKIIIETLKWVKREMTDPSGAFYSALDADSEGEEGKFYIWTKEELKKVLGDDFELAKDYFNINNKGYWEHDNYILLRDKTNDKIAQKHNLTLKELNTRIDIIKAQLLEVRNKRIRPGLDDKTLTSWNALMIKGYVDAYWAVNEHTFIETALNNADFILQHQLKKDGGLWHSYKKGTSKINGYLEDYCLTIEAFIALYEVTFDKKWLDAAKDLMEYAIKHFYDERTGMFFFTSNLDKDLIARKTEVLDNVIPASNSSIAKGLFLLGHYYDDNIYMDKAAQMLKNIQPHMSSYGPGYSNWGILMLNHIKPFYEVAIVGKEAHQKATSLHTTYLPNTLLVGASEESNLPLLENKFIRDKTMIYVCVNKACQLPTDDVKRAMSQILF